MRVRTVGASLCPLALALVGCGLLTGIDDLANVPGFDASTTPSDSSSLPPDDTEAPARCDPNKPFGTPTRVTELSVDEEIEDSDARLSPDERTIYFQSTRETDPKAHRIWVATRPDPDSKFETPTLIDLEPGTSFYDPVVTSDGLAIIVQRGNNGSKLQFSTRADPSAQFLPLQDVGGTDDPEQDERDPFLASDGRLLFTRMGPKGAPSPDLYIASGSINDGFTATALALVNTTSLERNPVLSSDGLRLFFSSDRNGAAGTQRIFTASRDDPTAPFGEPTEVDELAVVDGIHDYDAPTWISPDGCVLYLASNREGSGAQGTTHIFVARRPR